MSQGTENYSAQPPQNTAPQAYSGGYDATHPSRPAVGMVQAIKQYFLNYVTFHGRANRGEFWWPALALLIVNLLIQIPGYLLGSFDPSTGTATMAGPFAVVMWVLALATFLPSIAVAVRRFHDTGRSGWWYLIILVPLAGPIIWLVLLAGASKPEGVRFDNPDGSQPRVAA